MIDEFVEKFKTQYQGSGRVSLNRFVGNTSIAEFNRLEDILDIYGCAWYNLVSGLNDNNLVMYYDKFYSDIPKESLLNEASLKSLITYLEHDMYGYRGANGLWNHNKVQPDDVVRTFMQMVGGVRFEYSGWLRSNAAVQHQFQPLGLLTEKFLHMDFFGRHASNVGVVMNWDASFMDTDNSKYKLMVIDRWPDIIERLMRRFGGDNKKLPRFCYGFNDFYLLRPVAVSLLRDKVVPDEIFKWFCTWQFRRIWFKTPSDKLFAKAICKSWEGFREVIYGLGYKRNHLFNCLMRILHELGTIPMTREQIGDIYPSLIRAALKKNDKAAADFIQTL